MGAACARALVKRGSVVTIVDEKVTELDDFTIITPERVKFSNFDLLLVSPGWREDHPVVVAARAARIALINEVDLAWSLKAPGQKWIHFGHEPFRSWKEVQDFLRAIEHEANQ